MPPGGKGNSQALGDMWMSVPILWFSFCGCWRCSLDVWGATSVSAVLATSVDTWVPAWVDAVPPLVVVFVNILDAFSARLRRRPRTGRASLCSMVSSCLGPFIWAVPLLRAQVPAVEALGACRR